MGAVDVSIRHDDDLVVTQLVGIELVLADRCAERGNQRADFLAGQHLIETGALHVENLPAKRQDGLRFTRAALLGGTTGGVALDEKEFGFGRIALRAIGKLAGQRSDIERAFAARQFASLAGGFTGDGRFHNLADEYLRFGRVLFEPGESASLTRLPRPVALPTKRACPSSARKTWDREP